MQGYDRLLISMTYEIADATFPINNELLLARPKHENSMLTLDYEGERVHERENINGVVLLASYEKLNVNFFNAWSFEKFPLTQISTLFCFLDYQNKNSDSQVIKLNDHNKDGSQDSFTGMDNEKYILSVLENNSGRFMDIIISSMIYPGKDNLQNVFRFIRNMESYWIAYFLLSQVFNGDSDSDATKLYNACKIYGVSESYFRKLCHNAFTCGPKKQLRMWRAAHSALQLIEKDKSIATIAGNNGYSSSSHFSSEIKSIFGITPREFKKLEGLLHE